MRQKRAKTYKRVMALYVQTYRFRHPFQILVSDDLLTCPAAATLDLYKALSTSVQGEIKPMITQCCIQQLYSLPSSSSSSAIVRLAKTFERRKCNHREPIPSDQCLQETIGETNKHRYILAAQSSPLRAWGEKIAGLPIVHFNPRGVLVLAPPSAKTLGAKAEMEKERREEGEKLLDGVAEGGNVIGAAAAGRAPVDKGEVGRRKKAKEPNPLSVKKKKAGVAATVGGKDVNGKNEEGEAGKKRRRIEDGEGHEQGEDGDDANGIIAVGADDAGRRKKKRKRRGKGAVAEAIAEIRADRAARASPGVEAGGEAGSEADEEEEGSE